MTRPSAKTPARRALILCTTASVVALLAWPAGQEAWAQQLAALLRIEALSEQEREALLKALDRGRVLYEEDLFDRALKAFEEAYAIFAHPDVLYKIAQCKEKLGQDEDAARHYREVLRLNPEDPDRDKILAVIDALERRAAQAKASLKVHSQPVGANVLIAGQPLGKTPLTLMLEPGAYEVTLSLPGYASQTQRVQVERGQPGQLQVKLSLSRPEGELARAPRAERSRALPITLGSLGLLSGAAATTLWVLYSSASTDVENYNVQRRDIPRPADYNERVEARNTYGTAALITTGLAVGALSAAAALWVLQSGEGEPPSERASWRPWLSPQLSPTSVGLGLGLCFE